MQTRGGALKFQLDRKVDCLSAQTFQVITFKGNLGSWNLRVFKFEKFTAITTVVLCP